MDMNYLLSYSNYGENVTIANPLSLIYMIGTYFQEDVAKLAFVFQTVKLELSNDYYDYLVLNLYDFLAIPLVSSCKYFL